MPARASFRTVIIGVAVWSIAGLGSAQAGAQDPPPGAAQAADNDAIPDDVVAFIEAGEEARAKVIDEYMQIRLNLKKLRTPEARLGIKDVDAYLAECRDLDKPFAPYLPPEPKVGDRGRLWYPWVSVAQVVSDEELLVKMPIVQSQSQFVPPGASGWKQIAVCLRGFPTKDRVDDESFKVEVPLVVSGTADVKDGSRRTVLLFEELDMASYEKHWATVQKELKRKGRKAR